MWRGGLCCPHSGLSLQDTVLDACPPEASKPVSLPSLRERGAAELELVARELQALQEDLRVAGEARRAAWAARVRAERVPASADSGGVHTG